jgi:hypothetical protein
MAMDGSGISEKPSQNSEFYSEPLRSVGGPMSSVATAQLLTREIGDLLVPGAGWERQISAVHRELTSERRRWHLDLKWSRVKAWYYGEARRIDYHEVLALKELRAEEEARRARLKLAATANLLAAHLAAEGAPLDGNQMRALVRISGGLDLSGGAQ